MNAGFFLVEGAVQQTRVRAAPKVTSRSACYGQRLGQLECHEGFGRIFQLLAFGSQNVAGTATSSSNGTDGSSLLPTRDRTNGRSNGSPASDNGRILLLLRLCRLSERFCLQRNRTPFLWLDFRELK